ncbi:hypothetical protein M2459_002652 [Parabacteroides sp. PF5-5]|nr:hypothetical protein [Parabacteroides sp. PH5-39]MDH6316920.1 hypothetical protein [Parabacteroides sp. PF5-13]MDH6320989.1 hypothetical protein [Parabacteroides sp. PH5-13]MDH6324721.1 hypothetical protein [Parabacteroides sp. PH5-8]MDH6328105.1 hypothetical protein [Parabacteroides sp. PH5-41]MDH6335887.1 hypothetical protein [Parabacteroides sp. PF5-5]MDH6346971.1 hypothetical protein [Parabacteroides sp. PH5-46]MDH6361933.1 hypothetical protein [Parabacteroides sp. PH5-16]MDH6377601.
MYFFSLSKGGYFNQLGKEIIPCICDEIDIIYAEGVSITKKDYISGFEIKQQCNNELPF